jgi:hypothetical protein
MPDVVIRLGRVGVALAALAPLGLACQDLNTPIYFPSPVTPALAVTGAADAMGNPPRAENGLTLQFRNPTKDEQTELDTQMTTLGFDVPWIQRDHVHIEMTYQVTNSDTKAGMWNLGIDGANEYTKYDENIVAMVLGQGNNDAPQYIPLIPVTPQILGPGQTISGTVREDDFNEAELDLDALGRWMANFNAVLINNSQVDPTVFKTVPPNVVIPALIEIDVNFTADAMMTCTYDIRVRDDDDQLLHNTTDTLFSPTPTLFVPPATM